MSNFQFKQKSERVEKTCQECLSLLSSYKEDEIIARLFSDFETFFSSYKQQTKLTVAFIGQYNAGKSTLIKALTGDPAVRISAEVCTDVVTEYSWQDVSLVDTPGIYAGRTDHDQISLDRISKSDLLVFVVPNELFNPQGGDFFRRVANDMQRVRQMVLVVNKMSRERGQPNDLLKSILEVVEPHHPNDFHTCFIDADSYLKSQLESSPEEKSFLIEESNFDDFLFSLQKLVKKNELSARLATPLHRAIDLLEQSRNILVTNDRIISDSLELLRRKILLFRASRARFQNDCRSELNRHEHEIMMLGEKVASKIDGQHKEEEINLEIKKAEQEIESASQKMLNRIQVALKEELEKLQNQLEELMQSPLGRSLREKFEIASARRREFGYREVGQGSEIPDFLRRSPEAIQGASRFASTVSRDLVYNIGKFFGVKFKPWGAVNGAKFIRSLGPIVAGVGSILEIFLAVKEEKDEADYEQKLREARAEIRQNFRKAASGIRDEYETNIRGEILSVFYEAEIQDVEHQQSELRSADESKSDILKQIQTKLKEIKQEISSLE